jgi:hypothetical protein
VDIPANAAQTFVFALTPTAAIPATDVPLNFFCANALAAPVVSGLNTLLLSASTTPVPDESDLCALQGRRGRATRVDERCGENPVRRAAPAVLLGVALVAGHPATMANAEPRMRVVYQAPLISIDASGVTAAEVLREIGRTVGFSVVEAGSSDARLSFSIHDASLPEALRELLRSENHVLLYREGTETLATVMVLGTRIARAPTPFKNQDQGGMNPPPEIAPTSATPVSGAPPPTPADVAEYRRVAEGSPEVANATDLLLRHAWSGVAAPQMTSSSGDVPAASSSAIPTDAGTSSRLT